MIVFCKVCRNEFHPRPSHVKKGWGVFCSMNCKKIGTRVRQEVCCFTCKKKLQKTTAQISHSKSGKYFCSKSCQTKWRNTEYVGFKHKNFKGGDFTYQSILARRGISKVCAFCGEKDARVLATHHIDGNHKNNNSENLAWLCHNCHALVHYANVERQKFLVRHHKKLGK